MPQKTFRNSAKNPPTTKITAASAQIAIRIAPRIIIPIPKNTAAPPIISHQRSRSPKPPENDPAEIAARPKMMNSSPRAIRTLASYVSSRP
jgi:hypothetical protein